MKPVAHYYLNFLEKYGKPYIRWCDKGNKHNFVTLSNLNVFNPKQWNKLKIYFTALILKSSIRIGFSTPLPPT